MEVFVLGGEGGGVAGSRTDAVKKKSIYNKGPAKPWGHRDWPQVGSVL